MAFAIAIAFALTDRPPDAALLQAAEPGKLNSSTDAQVQIARMLQDDAIDKPRILRFFQEFFGYSQAHKVFKDEDRSGGFAYYGENYPAMYEKDADFFVMNILEKDQDVLRQLLTSAEYYIINRATFRNTVFDFYKNNQQQLDAGEYLIVGGGGGKLKLPGRYLRYPKYGKKGCRTIGDWWTTLLNAYGNPIKYYGNEDLVLKQNGCSHAGPLEELLV